MILKQFHSCLRSTVFSVQMKSFIKHKWNFKIKNIELTRLRDIISDTTNPLVHDYSSLHIQAFKNLIISLGSAYFLPFFMRETVYRSS